jgi:tripeptidyl-peptidase-1
MDDGYGCPPGDSDPPIEGDPRNDKRAINQDEYCRTTVATIRNHYNWHKELESYGADGNQSVIGAIEQQFKPTDVRKWQEWNNLPFTEISVHGLNNPNTCTQSLEKCHEASLDIQYILSVNSKAPTWFWSIPNNPFFSPFFSFVTELNAIRDPPDVHSISYANSERYMSPIEARIFNQEACKLGLRGITIIVASGDTGAHGIEGCHPPPDNIPFADNCTIAPIFPACCPYVTVVGATTGPDCNITRDEIAATVDNNSKITSGGGFSNIFERPAWQNKAVKHYLTHNNQNGPKNFNTNGRAYPDVALLGTNYRVWINGSAFLLSGTSASAPVFASLISLANSIRSAHGKPKLGFLNPLLYNKLLADSFNDIKVGNNRCCKRKQWCCEEGFDAGEGWDPVTGLGSLDFKKFLSIIEDYPNHSRSEEEPSAPVNGD